MGVALVGVAQEFVVQDFVGQDFVGQEFVVGVGLELACGDVATLVVQI